MKNQLIILLFGILSISNSQAQDFAEVKLADSLSISFDVGSSTVKNTTAFLNRIKDLKLTNGKIKVIAYTDTVGSTEYNKNLASKRMNAILKLVESTNLKTFVLDTINKNEERKMRSNNEETFRRVDVIVYSVKPVIKYNVPMNLKINFDSGTSNIVNNSMETLRVLELLMKIDLSINIKLNGHVCCEPDMKLSTDRAEKVKSYLVDHGISANRINCKGYSNEAKLFPESNELNKRKNMRVDVVFMK